MGGIFVCYRRDDRHAAGRLYDSLQQQFSSDQIFLDVDAVEPGLSFLQVIQERIAASDAILVVIGPDWLDARDSGGQRRLDDPDDFVRVEIEAGLQRGIRVVPVLIDRAAMPRAADLPASLRTLASRNAVTLSHTSFQRDAEHLNTALSKIVKSGKARPRLKQSLMSDVEAATADAGSDAASGWKAEFAKRDRNYFLIRLWRGDEHHRLELRMSWWHITEKVELDGSVLSEFMNTGRKAINFQVGSHAARFQLKFVGTSFQRIKAIELWVDNRLILSSD